jgi:carboxylesterase type B
VLVHGQSAGAALSWVLSTLPSAKSLMTAVIGESGAGIWAASPDTVANFTKDYASNLGCSSNVCLDYSGCTELNV